MTYLWLRECNNINGIYKKQINPMEKWESGGIMEVVEKGKGHFWMEISPKDGKSA